MRNNNHLPSPEDSTPAEVGDKLRDELITKSRAHIEKMRGKSTEARIRIMARGKERRRLEVFLGAMGMEPRVMEIFSVLGLADFERSVVEEGLDVSRYHRRTTADGKLYINGYYLEPPRSDELPDTP